MAPDERRRHGRTECDLPCSFVAGEAMGDGRILELSQGGARVLASAEQAEIGSVLLLGIEPPEPLPTVDLAGEVVRVDSHPEGALYAVRFRDVLPEVADALERVLAAVLSGPGRGDRAHPRVARRLDLTCTSPEEFEARLNDLSRGGLAMISPEPLEIGTSVTVRFGSEEFPGLLDLRGEVIHAELVEGGHRVGLRFAKLDTRTEGQIRALISILMGLGPRQGVFED